MVTIQPLFFKLIGDWKTLTDTYTADAFSKYFCGIVQSSPVPINFSALSNLDEINENITDNVKESLNITLFSIKMITNTIKEKKTFSFNVITLNGLLKELGKLNSKKTIQATDMPSKIIKENKDLISCCVYYSFNNS